MDKCKIVNPVFVENNTLDCMSLMFGWSKEKEVLHTVTKYRPISNQDTD